jgi:general secretion pathway protein D
VGAEVPILSEQLITTSGGVPSVSNSIQYRPTGIILKVKPIISDSGIVTLKITEEVSDAIPNNISPDIRSPIITKRSATTTLLLRDGQVALLGGIIQNRFEDSKQGVPGMSDIPLLGDVLSSRDKSMSTTELIVLIRVVVVESPEENREVLGSFRDKLKLMRDILSSEGKN